MKVSVCMATYNGANYIKEQLESILSQLDFDDEIIISDDNSTDTTVSIIKSFSDDRIKLIVNREKLGYTKNFENALNQVSGDYIFLSDQDDVWYNNKVSKMKVALKKSFMVVSNAEIVDSNLNQINPSHFELHGTKKGFFINFLMTRYIGACMAFRRDVLIKALPFPDNQNLCPHDYWLALISEFYYNVYLIKEPLIKYRRHSTNASTGGKFSRNSIFKIVRTRFYIMTKLISRKI